VNPLVFTRYLYPREQVNHSLLLALLDKEVDEALFWTYELYHSGFEEQLYEYIYSIYETFYKLSNNISLGKCLRDFYDNWLKDKSQHCLFGSMIKNLICRPFNVNLFMETYLNIKCEPFVPIEKEGKFLRMKYTKEEAKKFDTIKAEFQKARFILPKAYLYSIRHNVSVLFQCSSIDIKQQYQMNWTYYCWNCPYWRNIIEEMNFGRINHSTKSVDFEEEDIDEFYDYYGYEPDEQPMEVQQKSIGNGLEKQMTIKEFADLYGGTMVKKTIRPPVIIK